MEEQNNWASGFEFVDIEIIDHHRQPEVLNPQKWSCDHCNLFYLSYENLMEHKKKHMNNSQVKCRYCNKVLSVTEESRECYANGKCETCEYRCSQCPKRFLRHSSLMNHENNHSQPKKNKRPHPRSANIEVPKLESTQKTVNKKILKTVDSEALCSNSAPVETDIPTKGKRKPSSSPKKRTRLQSQKPMIESNINDGDIDINNSRVSKRSSLILLKDNHNLKSSKQTKEKFIKTSDTAITKNQVGVSTPTAQTGTSSSEVNSVNYKPFSCHVCNDNFASENILLEHIKSHGDAAKHFKCRFCPEAFDTIYDIQYHLAVCPLAEDELESTLMNSTPPKLVITSPRSLNKPLTKGKRGRPKKFRDSLPNSKEEMVTSDIAKSDSAPLVRTRNKRKSLEKPVEPSNKILKVSSSSVPDTTVKNRSVEREVKFDDPQSNLSETDVTGDDYQSPNNDSFVTSVKNQEKHHSCPFPRCDRKFTREKALECHMRNHNDDLDETLQCYKCDIPFDDVKSLRMHVDECQGLREEKDDDFSGPKQNKNERQDANKTGPHKFGDDFLCKTCGRTYQSKEKLKSHLCTDRTIFIRKCNIGPCNKEFNSELEENDHLVEHLPKGTEIVHKNRGMNNIPNVHKTVSKISLGRRSSETQSFTRSSSITKHLFNCYPFDSMKDPLSNGLIQNSKDQVHPCPVSSKKDTSRRNPSKHTNEQNKRVNCPVCLVTYKNVKFLSVHVKDVHVSKYNSLTCQLCNHSVKDSNTLLKHLLGHVASTTSSEFGPPCKSGSNELKRKNQIPVLSSTGSNPTETCDRLLRLRVANNQKVNHNHNTQHNKELNLCSNSLVIDNIDSNVKDLHDKTLRIKRLPYESNSKKKRKSRTSQKQILTKQSKGVDLDFNRPKETLYNKSLKPQFTEKQENVRKKQNMANQKRSMNEGNTSKVNHRSEIEKKRISCHLSQDQKPKRSSYYREKMEAEVICPLCLQKFAEQSHLQSHIINKHLKVFLNKCMICHKTEANHKLLSLHMLKHTSENYCNISVDRSVQSQINQSVLQNENISFESHQKEKSVKQKTCSQTLPSTSKTVPSAENTLQELVNVQVQVKQETQYQDLNEISVVYANVDETCAHRNVCQICNKGFMTLEELKTHIRSHIE